MVLTMLGVVRHVVATAAASRFDCARCTYATLKRFYRQADILRADGKFEVRLDQRRLKTPQGKPLQLDSEELALAVAAEWDSQDPHILRANMHLTSLCNTAADNPNRLTKHDIANHLITCLPTDTLLFHSTEDDELYKFQLEKWDPVLEWFRHRYGVNVEKSRGFDTPVISSELKAKLTRHIVSYDFPATVAVMFGADTLKSVILMMACVERFVTPEAAVLLSRLEEEFQVGYWGRVESAHEVTQQVMQARVSAALFLIQCSHRQHSLLKKSKQK